MGCPDSRSVDCGPEISAAGAAHVSGRLTAAANSTASLTPGTWGECMYVLYTRVTRQVNQGKLFLRSSQKSPSTLKVSFIISFTTPIQIFRVSVVGQSGITDI